VVDGTQYVSVAVGWGGVYGESQRATDKEGPGTVFTFAIGGKAPLPEFAKYPMGDLLEGVKYDAANVGPGTQLYVSHCGFCHGVPGVDKGGNIRNLGYSDSATIANLKDIVFKGPFMSLGMPDFTGRLSEDDVVKIQAFIQGTADAVRPKK
jgi:quinohemoprotein ethanol dehydrogenase